VSGVSSYREMATEMPAVGLAISLDESVGEAADSTAHVRFDVCPTWLELAIRHLSDAQVAQVARVTAWKGADENSKAGALEWEFEASIQSIMASSIALDAFCTAVQPKVQPPQSTVSQLREKRIPHHAEISEILRVAFALTTKEVTNLRLNLGEIFRFRDLAINSSSKSGAPILHPELGTGGEWRFAYFRCENARLIVRATLQLIWELVASDKPKDAHVQKYVDALRSRLDRLRHSDALKADAAETGARGPHVAQTRV
jgi:hypothetical protein